MKNMNKKLISDNNENKNNKRPKVFIIHPINKIKKKIGSLAKDKVIFSNEAIIKANSQDKNFEEKANNEIESTIKNLFDLWETTKQRIRTNKDFRHNEKMFYIYINRLYELSLQFSLPTIEEFSKSLKVFVEESDTMKKNHHVIIQAHLDVIKLSFLRKISSKNSEEFHELKKNLIIAIQKNI